MLRLLLAACAACVSACALAESIPTQYDEKIKISCATYMPDVDWRLFKAQLYQESRLDPSAVNHIGAEGIAQFVPETWRDISERLGLKGSPLDADLAIEASAYYMANLREQWSSSRPEADRHSLALASYNAGLSSILKAQELCGGAVLYADIIKCLPQVTGRHSKETVSYVKRVWTFAVQMITEG